MSLDNLRRHVSTLNTEIPNEVLFPLITDNTCLVWEGDKACLFVDPLANSPNKILRTDSANQNSAAICGQKFLGICVVRPATSPEASIFGFAEFVTALALLIVIYTVSDVRYRFRIATAPVSLFRLTFFSIITIGLGTLFGDIWFAERWPLPNVIADQYIWQGLFGILFFLIILIWMYFSFISPPIFGKLNYHQFTQELYRIVLKGSDSELPVIAAELARSAAAIVKLSRRNLPRGSFKDSTKCQTKMRKPGVHEYAYDLLLLIGNRKLCRHIVASSPVTAIAFFEAMAIDEKYNIPIAQFARNISTEAIVNKDSILYHEDEGYSSGLIGYLRPFSKTIYGNFTLVEALASNFGSPLDLNYQVIRSWDAEQLCAYCRAVKITLESYLESGHWHRHSYALYRALEIIKSSCRDIYKLNGLSTDWFETDIYKRLGAAVDFVIDAIELIEKQKTPPSAVLRLRKGDHLSKKSFYDHLADLMFEIVFAATSVTAPSDTCWSIQHNSVWGNFFGLRSGSAWAVIRFKLRRLLFDEIRELEKLPNYKSSRILALCLNVMGVELRAEKKIGYGSDFYALKKAMLNWTRKNYLRLMKVQPDVAASCLIDTISFDEKNRRLVKTYIKGLNLEAPKDYLELEDTP